MPETDPKNCALLEFPRITDPRGNLSFPDNARHLPFDIKRVFYSYDVPAGARRAAHAVIKCQQCLIATAGSPDVPAGVWRELLNFSANSVCLVMASEFYDPDDYFEDYTAFRKAIGGQQA